MFQLLLAIIYLAFINLGLPDSLLGSAWPSVYQEFSVPISYMGGISMIIAIGTIISSLQCDRLTKKIGTGKVTAVSVLMTAVRFVQQSYPPNRLIKFLYVGSRILLHHFLHPYHY